MDYKKTIEDFLDSKPKAEKGYRYKLKVFHAFLIEERSMDDTNYSLIMASLKPQDIIDSVKYYIKNCKVKYKLTVDVYFFAISTFFNYLYLIHRIENEMFSKKQEQLYLKQMVDDTVKELGLKAKQVFAPLTDDEIDGLINYCNKILNDPNTDKFSFSDQQKYNKKFTLFMSALIVKIIIFSGVSNETLLTMTTSDVHKDLGKLKINGYWVHMPDDLSLQMRKYIDNREDIVQDEKNKILFFSAETFRKTNNGQMLKVLNEFAGHSRAMSIAKHSIIRKLEAGIPSDMIMEFTGYSGDILGHCLEIYNDQLGLSANKTLDVGLHADRYFDHL